MSDSFTPLSLEQLIQVFSLTKTATALHIGEPAYVYFANDAMLRIWGKDESVIGKSLEEALPELKGQPFIEMFARVWREGLTLSGSDTAATLEVDGKLQTFYFDFEYRAVLDQEGKTICVLHSAIDVTDRVTGDEAIKVANEKSEALLREQALNEELSASTEELSATVDELRESEDRLSRLTETLEEKVKLRVGELAESEKRFRIMAEGSEILIAVADDTGNAVYFNNAWETFTGRSKQELLSFGWADLIHPDDREGWLKNYFAAIEQQHPFTGEFRILNNQGMYRWLFAQGPVRSRPDGSFAGFISSCVDITDRKEEELRSLTLNTILENSSEFIGLFAPDLSLVYVNPAALSKLGWKDFKGKNILDCIYPDDLERARNFMPALTVHGSFKEEIRFYNAETGVPFWIEWNAFMIKSKTTGDIVSFGTVNPDITERRYHDEQLQSINEEMAAANEELASTNEEMIATNEELEQSHRELLASENRFRTLIRQAPFGICIIRAEDLMILDANDNYLELVGKSRSELEKRLVWEAVPEAADSYAPVMQQVIRTGKAFVADEHELVLVRNGVPEAVFVDFIYEPVFNATGNVVTIMVVGTDVTDKVMSRRKIEDIEERIRLAVEAGDIGTYDFDYLTGTLTTSQRFNEIYGLNAENVSRDNVLATYHPGDRHLSGEAHQAALSTGKIAYEARVIHPDQSMHWVRIQGNVYLDEHGQRLRALGTVIDITDYKSLQQQKDDFISIASHELKTPITSLKASLQLMERMARDHDTSALPFLLEQSTRSMSKISELVEDLLNVARIREGQIMLNKTRFTISHLLNDCCNHVRAEGKYNLILEGDKELAIVADEQRIDQVVVNFVNNAVKYAPTSRDIYLTVSREGNNARVAVKDIGPGIPPEKIPHLFDRFYRVEESGTQASGLGLGLYISADIIARHNGKIGVDSELGKGSTFWFTLPLDD